MSEPVTDPVTDAAQNDAPGAPGIPPRWTSSAKEGVGTSLSAASRVWFTLSHGILNEIYYPRLDQACTRDFGLIVTADDGFFSEEKRDTSHLIMPVEQGVPAFRLVNRCNQDRYEIQKEVIADPRRDVVLQRIRFLQLNPSLPRHRLYTLLAPHLVNGGAFNSAWVGDYKGVPMLFAEGGGSALALACSLRWSARSVGFVGVSDGWQDLSQHGRLTWNYTRAGKGNVALTAEIDLSSLNAPAEPLVLALAFGRSWAEAALQARASLQSGFDSALQSYCEIWRMWQASLLKLDQLPAPPAATAPNRYRVSTAVLRSHESGNFSGGIIASLSIPWGFEKSDDDLGGYHLVWPRDLAETAGGLLACGAHTDALRVIEYLAATQEADGHWPQNSWLDGTPYWRGTQMDECAFPALLVDLARRENALDPRNLEHYWAMVRQAACFILANGPLTSQDRWEEDGGYTPFTLAVEIASLLASADLAELQGLPEEARFLRETADAWNAQIESWTYVENTALAEQVGVSGYYVRIAPPESIARGSAIGSLLPVRNRLPDATLQQSESIVSPDALALVRFGLRRADDPRIVNTVKVIDSILKVDFPNGPCWRRYNCDGYGEHADGTAFNGTGIGRVWPLLTGERAHYELLAGRPERAAELLATLEAFGSNGALLPEQSWDAPDIPERELFFGKPTGSAMPLVWAHAEHIKLLRSLADGRVFDLPPQPVARYLGGLPSAAPSKLWRINNKSTMMKKGMRLRIELLTPATVRWSSNHWTDSVDVDTEDSALGLSVIALATEALEAGSSVLFTWRDKRTGAWHGSDYMLAIS